MKPALLHGEKLQFDGLRCFLISDGRELGVRSEENTNIVPDSHDEINIGTDIGGPCLIPAEGALFLTNYRVIFKGTPIDQFGKYRVIFKGTPIDQFGKPARKETLCHETQ